MSVLLDHSTLRVTHDDDHITAAFQHDLDMESMLQLKPEMEKIMARVNAPLVVDLAAVNFLDSSAVGVIALFFRHAQQQRLPMFIVAANPQPEAVLSMVGLTTYVPLYPDVKSALNSLA